MLKKETWYGIEKGANTGVTNDWGMAKQQVDGYKGNSYMKFSSPGEARQFSEGNHPRSQGDTKFYGGKPYESRK